MKPNSQGFKHPPIQQNHKSMRFFYGAELFECGSPYFYALRDTLKLGEKIRPDRISQDWQRLRVTLVHECEQAKLWLQLWETKDDPQRAKDEWYQISRQTLGPLVGKLEEIASLDRRQGYDLRHAFHRSGQFAVSESETKEAWCPDPNLPDGGYFLPVGGRIAQNVELQFISRLFLMRFPEWLKHLTVEIDNLHAGFELGRSIGPMLIDPPLARTQVLKRSGEQLAILALVARLQWIFRKITDTRYQSSAILQNMIFGAIPTYGRPCWDLITAFVHATFSQAPDQRTLEQRWSSFCKSRAIQLEDWPQAVERQAAEPQ